MKIIRESTKSKARLTLIRLKQGVIKTPAFLPDATRALIKGLSSEDVANLGLQAMVVNTFHLYLQPGEKLISRLGGVNSFMQSPLPLVSDSGGFQVFSLVHRGKNMGKIDEKGVKFRSPFDGSWHFLSPKKSIEIQFDLVTDIIICFDDCPPNEFAKDDLRMSVKRTIAWAKKCKEEYDKIIKKKKISLRDRPKLLAVIQGGAYSDLRRKCAIGLKEIGFDAYGFGARPVDKDGNFLANIVSLTAEAIPTDSFRFALGVGKPEDILRFVLSGWDLFDCVIPTREGRHGRLFYFNSVPQLFGKQGPRQFYKNININNSRFRTKNSPINKTSKLSELRHYSLAYLHHLFKIKDPLAGRLASLHNLEFYSDLMARIRQEIEEGKI